jgi:hypothetical protein
LCGVTASFGIHVEAATATICLFLSEKCKFYPAWQFTTEEEGMEGKGVCLLPVANQYHKTIHAAPVLDLRAVFSGKYSTSLFIHSIKLSHWSINDILPLD